MTFEETLSELQGFFGKHVHIAVSIATDRGTPGAALASLSGTLETVQTKADDEWAWLVLKERRASAIINNEPTFERAYWTQDHDAPTGELNIVQAGTVMTVAVAPGSAGQAA